MSRKADCCQLCWSPTSNVPRLNRAEFSVDPRVYLKAYSNVGFTPRGTAVEWAWLAIDNKLDIGGKTAHSPKFEMGIPSNQEVLSLEPANS